MAKQSSFDIVSKIDLAEVKNAVNQASKEIAQRYDLKNSGSEITLLEKESQIVLEVPDDFTRQQVDEVLRQKLARREVPMKALSYGDPQPAAGSRLRQTIDLQQGIPTEKAREIVKSIKNTKLRVQAAIQEDMVRVTGKDRDTLQEVIAHLKAEDFGIDMQYTNYR